MHVERLQLMVDMLREVEAGTWQPHRQKLANTRGALALYFEFPDRGIEVPQTPTFDLERWIYMLSNDDGSAGQCGFTACAVGHACLDERFVQEGLKWTISHFAPVYGGRIGFSAVATFFEIEQEMAGHLFAQERYTDPSPAAVRQRIERLLEVGEDRCLIGGWPA